MAAKEARKFYVARALESVSSLNDVLDELEEQEVRRCLLLESQTRRRRSIIMILARRAVKLNKQRFLEQLAGEIDAPYILKDSE
jgi:hypothetical protein